MTETQYDAIIVEIDPAPVLHWERGVYCRRAKGDDEATAPLSFLNVIGNIPGPWFAVLG